MGGCGVPALDAGGHGTGTASLAAGRTLGEDPEALIVSVAGDFFRGARWAARQPWIDAITLSLGAFVGTCTLGETCTAVGAGTGNPYVPFSMPWAQRIAYESGKRFFTGSSQGWTAWAGPAGASGPCPYMWDASFAGSPWTYAVETYWPWTEQPWRSSCFPPEVVAQGWDLVAASARSLNGTNGFGHASGATPQAAGAYARTLHEARRAIGSSQEGARSVPSLLSGVSARLGDAIVGEAAAGAQVPAMGPGADGVLRLSEVEQVYQHSLEQVDVATSYERHGHDPRWQEDVMPVDTLGLEVGYRLIPLVDKAQDGDLLKRINGARKKFAQEVGFLPPAVHIRDNLELRPNAYRITLKGAEVGHGEAYGGMYLAINPGRVTAVLPGAATQDPAFGLPAVWVEAALRDQAQTHGYTVVDASTVVTTHLNHLIHSHAAELLGRQELQQLLDHLGRNAPKLVEDLVPKLLPLSALQKVLQNLLEEGVHIRDMRTIVEILAEHAPRTQDTNELTVVTRNALGRAIVQQFYAPGAELQVISLNHDLESILMQAVQSST
ncbi:MAG: FHIPEP family type III secretion protein, partial [Euryarchaeota archaeon]|nr:FHIPEP family type III secretion protein [Euryarchaeota archaeon]